MFSETQYSKKVRKNLGKIKDKNLSRLKLEKKTSYGRPSHNNASSASSSIFPPTVFPRFDIERFALPVDEGSVGMKLSRQWQPSTLLQGRIALALAPLWAMFDVYGSIRACESAFFQSVVPIELCLFHHINLEMKLVKNHCKERTIYIYIYVYLRVILYPIYI